MVKNSFHFPVRFRAPRPFQAIRGLGALLREPGRPKLIQILSGCSMRADFLGLDPAAEAAQSLPAGVAGTLIAFADLAVAVFTTARAKSFAVRLAQRPDGQGQKYLLTEHILKRKAVFLIITDFRLLRSNGAFGGVRIRRRRAEDQVEISGQRDFDRLDAAGTRDLEVAGKAASEPNVGHDVFGAPVFVEDLGVARCGQRAVLLCLVAEIDLARSQFQVKV